LEGVTVKSAKRKGKKIENLTDMEVGYTLSQAIAEASRCLLCYDAPCSTSCPAGTDPGTFIRKLHLRNIKGAIRTIKNNNVMGCVCGVTCPTERLCQEACSATELDRPIDIGKLQRFLVEHGWETGFKPLKKEKKKKEKVAVVGSGPAGLSCAAELAKAGYQVTIFEAKEKPGGVLRYGVPEFRLNHEIVDREIKDITDLGVKIKCSTRIGKGGPCKLVKKGFGAVFVGTGLWYPYRLNIPGSDLANVTTATEFLEANRTGKRRKIKKMVQGKNVAIIGGGSVAMDVANLCKALGADRVYSICLEGLAEIPADKEDLDMALENYIIIKPQCQVTEILGEKGKVVGVKGTETQWVKPGVYVPANARTVPGTDYRLNVSAVVMAIGSGAAPETSELCPKVKCMKNNLIKTKKDGVSTGAEKVFAGGDIVRGPALIVDAVKDGKEAAARIIKMLSKKRKK